MQQQEKLLKVILRRFIILLSFISSGIKITIKKPYWQDSEVSAVLFASGIMNLANWIYLIGNRVKSDYPIILHYNLFYGVDFLGDYEKIFLLPTVGLIVIILNSFLGHIFYQRERLASYILTLNDFLVQAILLISSYLIIRANS